ncbi:DUF1800 family protein [Roseateles asaccharophilus]|uniref:Uncharacterized protein (DUF1800 family) n=1 Tax=Roseateles asaccharophilus TaxID=582607 RepID=A0ABU2ACD1_9BURK|nr:DUF1800 family protein [Roseateles asaccharophilus]MDR7334841.1 uncharacterized protein (DUF1800 family) [Roseateles asaccharophilus]
MRSFIHTSHPVTKVIATAVTIAALTACGGGKGGDSETPSASATSADPAASAAQDSNAQPTARALASTSTETAAPKLIIRARADVAGGIGAMMTVRINGVPIGTVEVKSTTLDSYTFNAPTLAAGVKIDIVFTNDGTVGGVDRNLHIAYISDGVTTIPSTISGAIVDRGPRTLAFDDLDTAPSQGSLFVDSALRLHWAGSPAPDPQAKAKVDAVRFLQQATFGPTTNDITKVVRDGYDSWISAQTAIPYGRDYFDHIQAKYAKGDSYRPKGANYSPGWVAQRFWERAAQAPDQLRRRTAFALHNIFMVSQADINLYPYQRAYAQYVDLLHKHAFGNYRNLLEDMALTPVMGIYLSHMRNRKEDPATGRMPDENFAREVMQLFSIGLHELNNDGTVKRDASGNPIETYNTADVMAMAKVFTGWSWAFLDSQLSESTFRYSTPSYAVTNDQQIEFMPMKAYASLHSTAEKKLFTGKAWATTLPAGSTAQADLKAALDTLFKHPNVGPFIGRQLIQHLVTSNPSPAYVGRVASVFNNNGQGVRGDLGAVVRAILLDTEARGAPLAEAGKLREPVLRVSHWMRALGAKSASGEYLLHESLEAQGQRALHAPSVFGYFRPGYVPPNTSFSMRNATSPEFQIINESTVAQWLNAAEFMVSGSIGIGGDVSNSYANEIAMASYNNISALPDHLNLMLLGGRMSPALRQQILDMTSQISLTSEGGATRRAHLAIFLTLASPEYLFQP